MVDKRRLLAIVVPAGGDAYLVVEPSWTSYHVAYRVGARHPVGRGAAGRAITSMIL
jgi:hypothetical protein